MKTKKRISWKRFHLLVKQLAAIVKEAGFVPDVIIGITRGGLVPLAIMGEIVGTKNVATISARSYDGVKKSELSVTALPEIDMKGKRVLLVDEITDSGETFKKIAELIRKRYEPKEVKTAVVVVNKAHCNHWPDFFVQETEVWVVFPWQEWPRRKRRGE